MADDNDRKDQEVPKAPDAGLPGVRESPEKADEPKQPEELKATVAAGTSGESAANLQTAADGSLPNPARRRRTARNPASPKSSRKRNLGGRGGGASDSSGSDEGKHSSSGGDSGPSGRQEPATDGDHDSARHGDSHHDPGSKVADSQSKRGQDDDKPKGPQFIDYGIDVRNTDDHPKQKAFIESTCKRRIVRAGRRSGKTTGASIFAIRQFVAGRRVLYAAPTFDQVSKFWNECRRTLGDLIEHGVYHKNETNHIIEMPGTEQHIRCKTAWNADTLRGDYADVLILDEWQLMHEDAWEAVGAPMLMDRNGTAVFIYTPPSLGSRQLSKARDVRHAATMFKEAMAEMKAAEAEGRESRWLAMHWSSMDSPFITQEGIEEVTSDMTALAIRQEILAEDLEEIPGALWKLSMIDQLRVDHAPAMSRIVVGIDPSGSAMTEAGIVAAGLGVDGHAYVLDDKSMHAPTPRNWAATAVSLYHTLRADRILAEENYGGDMVRQTIMTVDDTVPYKDANATRGKIVRAQPIVAMYEKGMVHHVGVFSKLEEEMCSYVEGNPSPNRMDALVWCLTDLLLGHSVLGVIEWQKAGGQTQALGASMRDEPKNPRVIEKVMEPTTLIKPVINDKTPSCPECGSHLVQALASGEKRCRQCGVQWGRKSTMTVGPNGQ